jgi:hypothetical protein
LLGSTPEIGLLETVLLWPYAAAVNLEIARV